MTSLFLLSVLFTQAPATPDATIQAYRAAIARADVEAFANLTQSPTGATLRKMAPPLKKAQAASEALSKALSEKPALGLSNPFANNLNPLTGYLLEVIELTPGKEQHLVRVRFGTAGKLQEETLSIKKEGDNFRVSLPSVYLKSVNGITPEQLTKQIDMLGKLTISMTSIAEQVAKGELTTKEAVLLKLAQAAKELDTNPKR
jgi:hypothetical protein